VWTTPEACRLKPPAVTTTSDVKPRGERVGRSTREDALRWRKRELAQTFDVAHLMRLHAEEAIDNRRLAVMAAIVSSLVRQACQISRSVCGIGLWRPVCCFTDGKHDGEPAADVRLGVNSVPDLRRTYREMTEDVRDLRIANVSVQANRLESATLTVTGSSSNAVAMDAAKAVAPTA